MMVLAETDFDILQGNGAQVRQFLQTVISTGGETCSSSARGSVGRFKPLQRRKYEKITGKMGKIK
jgi:hypothetical protein